MANTSGPVLPLIDFGPFLSGAPSERQRTAEAIADGFKSVGFIYLSNYGIASSLVQDVFANSARLFALSQETKDALGSISTDINRGYIAPGREKLAEKGEDHFVVAKVPDLKETFEIGREGPDQEPNMWYDEKFKSVMCEMFAQGQTLHVQIMRAIAIGLGLKEGFFDAKVDHGDNSLRLLHYPSVDKEVFRANEKQVRAGAHTDYGDITILFQDNQGGLQVKNTNGEFVNATPIPGTVVVNAGDLLARWSNDVIKSTLHRVVEPPSMEEKMYPARYSVAYFGQPNLEALIEGIPGTIGEGENNKYAPVTSGGYLIGRLKATYSF